MGNTIIAVIAAIGALVAGLVALRSFLQKRPEDFQLEVSEPAVLVAERFCLCGEPATEGLPYLHRERDPEPPARMWGQSPDRNVYATTPLYRRMVSSEKMLCRVHAHVADAKVDNFLYKQRALLSEVNERIAVEAAAFEKQDMTKSLEASLTNLERQNKKSKNGETNGVTVAALPAPSN